ncbi:myosin-4-like [Pecten maximus]|uniref:myosin-4-like n=1 Tax=Pecten maximus TaxID=6579 RepID=UPI001458006D|nr:myosin-4-like [Pecten maximus]XP_033762335.1 myosin-4-like [Pecten maximus]
MPPQTSLQFFRKRQTVDTLLLERPQSLSAFYQAVEVALKDIEIQLIEVQASFYGRTRTVEDEIRQWMPALEHTMQFAKVSELICKGNLQNLFDLYDRSMGDPTMEVKFDKVSVQAVMQVIDKVLSYLKTGFASIMDTLKSVSGFMRKYCLSFVSTDGDAFLETATNYEKQRRDYANAIQINLDDITQMAERFEKDGIHLQELGSIPKQLADKYECKHVPLLVMFPGACENIRNACIGIRKWIQADHGYPTFLQYDLQDLEKRHDDFNKTIRDLQLTSSHLDHRVKVYKRDISECEAELKRLLSKEKMIKRQSEGLGHELKDLEMEIGYREIRREQLKHDEQESSNRQKLEQNMTELENYRSKRLIVYRKYEEMKRKLHFLQLKRDKKVQKEEELGELRKEHKAARKELRKTELEKDRLQMNVMKMREIIRFKTSPEILKKLFYNMPLTSKNTGLTKRKKGAGNVVDKLERASRVAATHIDVDWPKLYRVLPFYPPRGDENVRIDIDEIGRVFMRDIQETQAKQSLAKWRRMHNRASVDDLKAALHQIRRKDIVEEIDTELAKRANKVKQENLQKAESPTRTVRFPRVLVQPPQTPRSRNSGMMFVH